MKNKEKKVIRLLIAAGVIISILSFFVTNQAETIRINGQKITKTEVTIDQLRGELGNIQETLYSKSKDNAILQYRLGKICLASRMSDLTKDTLIQIIEEAQSEISEYLGSKEFSRLYAEKDLEARKWKSAYYGTTSSIERWSDAYRDLEINTRSSRRTQDSLTVIIRKLNKENKKLMQIASGKIPDDERKKIDLLIADKDRKIDSISQKIESLKKESKAVYSQQFYYIAEVLKKRFGKREKVKRLLDNTVTAPEVDKIFLTFDINRELFFDQKEEKNIKFILKNNSDAVIDEYTEKLNRKSDKFNKAIFNNLKLIAGNYSIKVVDEETGLELIPDYEIALF